MSAHPPPIPPEQQAPHGGATAKEPSGVRPPADPNTTEQGRQGNLAQNTRHPGTQQDR
jgi:hypothetical protein